MSRVADQLAALWPALAFLLAGVPLAALLDRIGFFDAVATVMTGRTREISVLGLWVLAALTTVVLNLDTTVVLLTPLYLRIARRVGVDPIALVAIPLLLASLASSVLPVSNLTTLIVVDRFHLGVGEVVAHLAMPSLAATAVGWWAYRRQYATRLPAGPTASPDRHALVVGGSVVSVVLVGFVLGPSVGIAPWITAVAADVVLMIVTRTVPWRALPLVTAAGVAALAALVALVVPSNALTGLLSRDHPGAIAGIGLLAAGVANLVNNLPTVLLAHPAGGPMSWGMWAWLLGANTGAVLLPIGALANLLWWRIARDEGLRVGLRRYVSITVPIAGPALIAAVVVLGAERALTGKL